MAKNELSRLLRLVKEGQTVLITERNRPIARLQPFASEGQEMPDVLASLYANGILAPPSHAPLDVATFRAASRPRLAHTRSLVGAILAEREEGR